MEGEIPWGLLGLLGVLLVLSAFFSGSETALMSLNRYQLRHKAREGHRGARLAEKLLQRPDRLIGLILMGNNLVNFTAAVILGAAAREMGGEPAVVVATILFTFVVLIFAEAAPKTLAALSPEKLAFPASIVYYPLLKILYPFVWLINVCSNGVLYLVGVRESGNQLQSLSQEELRTLVDEAGNRISNRYRRMLISILDLEKVTVDDVMVPHNEIQGVDLAESEQAINTILHESVHTRLPVFTDTIDQVEGILHLRRLANLAEQAVSREGIREILTEPYFVPEGTPLSTQLIQFQRRRERIALVVDEYGDIQGIVTLEDILEEIVGEFTTDPADDMLDVIRESSGNFLVDASANVRDLNRSQHWDLPTNGPKTLNGLIVEQLEEIPPRLSTHTIHGYPMTIISVEDNRIQEVRVGQKQLDTDEQPS
ncbi:MAG: HlyC/CorC family transporter [Pseudomonadota bacterium]